MIKEVLTVMGAVAAGVGLGYLVRGRVTSSDEGGEQKSTNKLGVDLDKEALARIEELHQEFLNTDHERYFFTTQTSKRSRPMYAGLDTLQKTRDFARESAESWKNGFALVWDAKTSQPIELHEWDKDQQRVLGYAMTDDGLELKW